MRNDIDIEYFRKRLKERLEDIAGGQKACPPVELDQSRVGRLSRMDSMQQQAMAQAVIRLLGIEHQRILTALSRIESGDYGYCMNCDEEIAEGRLRVDPSVLICISCARATERQ